MRPTKAGKQPHAEESLGQVGTAPANGPQSPAPAGGCGDTGTRASLQPQQVAQHPAHTGGLG